MKALAAVQTTSKQSSATGSNFFLQRKCACGGPAGLSGTCEECSDKKLLGQPLQAKLVVGPVDDPLEREADQAAEQVLAGGPRPALTPLAGAPLQREDDKKKEPPSPLGEGLATVGKNLGENNPAFSTFSEQLAARFLAQPAPISVGVPTFLGANYAFLWGMAMIDPAMRRSFDDFNLAMLPGLVPQFPIKTFQYRILDNAQTRFAFELGLDASKLMTAFNEGVLNTHVSSVKFDSVGKLDTTGPKPVSLSALQVQLGLFGDGVMLSGGFRNGISPYPLMGDDGSRVMAQTPALPDLYPDRRDVRFTLNLDLLKLAGHFGSPPPAPRAPEQIQREASGDVAAVAPDAAVQSALAGAGAPLDQTTRGFMESRFGHDFGRVRIHADSGAAASARAVRAHAYTVGADIAFDIGRYAPHTDTGRHLLAHELAHVVQQGASASGQLQRMPVPGGTPKPLPAGPMLPPTTPRSTTANTPASTGCPDCQPTLTPQQAVDQEPLRVMLEMGRLRAVKALALALAAMTSPLQPPLRRLFEAQFGTGSATPQAEAGVRAALQGAHDFLKASKVWDPDTGHGQIHVNAGGQTPGCTGNNAAWYESGHVVVCALQPATAQMLSPPTVDTVMKVQERRVGESSSAPIHQVPDERATALAQADSNAAYATKLARMLIHEAVHHMIQPGVVDIYQDERLFGQLGGKPGRHGINLSPLALQNPDSLAAFALRAPQAAGGNSLPGMAEALTPSQKLSRPVAVRPLRSRKRARLMVDLAQEAIAQTDERLSVLHSEVVSVASNGSTPWNLFPPASQQMAGWLNTLGGETVFAQADAAAELRLQALNSHFATLQKSLRNQQVSVGRRFTQDRAQRLELAIPDWKSFRTLPPSAQLERMVVALLATAGLGRPIADVVLVHARLHGGMGALAVGTALPALASAATDGSAPTPGKTLSPPLTSPAGTADEEAMR